MLPAAMPSKNLLTINNGWPFGEGPLECGIRFEIRDSRVFIVCATCPQGVFVATEPADVAADPEHPAAYTVTLAFLKARVADHWLKVHPEEIAGQTSC